MLIVLFRSRLVDAPEGCAGRERWYEYYKLDITTVVRSKAFTREQDATAAIDERRPSQ
jgi:hypothetical protein